MRDSTGRFGWVCVPFLRSTHVQVCHSLLPSFFGISKVFPTCIIQSFSSCLRASETPILRIVYFLFACQRYWCLCQKPTTEVTMSMVRSWSFEKFQIKTWLSTSPVMSHTSKSAATKWGEDRHNATRCFSIRISKIKRHRLKLSKTIAESNWLQ